MVQLLGYHTVALAGRRTDANHIQLTSGDVDEAISLARTTYEARNLKPFVQELSGAERDYLRACAACLDNDRTADVGDITTALGKSSKQVSYVRDRLIKGGTLISAGRGKLMFNVPYLASYLLREDSCDADVRLNRSWGV